MNRILITPRSITQKPGPELNALRDAGYELIFSMPGQTPTETELLDLVPGCVAWLAGVENISERVLRAAKDLWVISRNGTGIDNIPVQTAEELGIEICKADGSNARGVAELAITLALCSLRFVPLIHSKLKQGAWELLRGREIRDRRFGLIGGGAVGRIVAQLAIGLGAQVAAYDPYPNHNFNPGDRFSWSSSESVFADSDIVSLHCPPTSDGKSVVDSVVLEAMKSDSCLINTARGSLIDESAVIDALDSGKLSTYATDVFNSEPPDPCSKLLQHPRTIVTPHIAALTEESIRRATERAVENLLDSLRKRP
jgi:D-3-phosphoglycerate dehydrogenase / 2-oxoglutarate reductase